MTQPRIKVLQFMYGTQEYFLWSEWINRRYCERHGYDYVVRYDEPRKDRHVCWHKIPLIIDELRDCDYLLFVDADAVFYSHDLTVENELIPELHGKSILMAADCAGESLRWNPSLPNSGVILVKNNDQAKQFFAEWDGMTETDEETRWQWPPTQRALWNGVLPKYQDIVNTAVNYYCANGRWGQYIRHFCLSSDKKRTDLMKTIYSRLTAPFYEVIRDKPVIKVVQYHWGEQNRSYTVNQQINEMYCRRHGYEYILKTFVPRDDRAVHWSKIPAMREELHDCDFLLFMDADAFFYSHELRIEDELVPLLEDKQIMMSADCVHEGDRHQPHKPNTGVILVRNTEKAAEFLHEWDMASEQPGLEHFRFHLFYEQEACFRTVWQKYAEDVQLLKEYYLMNSVYGMYIRHFMGRPEDFRLRYQEQFLNSLKSTQSSRHSQDAVIPRNKWKWGIGMFTTKSRTQGMRARTLESYRGSGFDPPTLFTDSNQNGGIWNLHHALKTLVEESPDADAYMIVEGNVLFSKNMREYLEKELWHSVGDHGCICSVFTPTIYASPDRWHAENRGSRTWMSQCQIYHPLSAKKMVSDLEKELRLPSPQRQIDAAVGGWAEDNGVNIWFHSPSLTQHVFPQKTSYETNRFLDARIGYARDFIGVNRSIHEYWAEFGTKPRKRHLLPRLEIVAKADSTEDGTPFQFTPEMALSLAHKLDQYNCDVGEISFVGDELTAWQYAGRCVYPLCITGKIMRTKITFSPKTEIDLRPYRLLFDAIDMIDDGTQPSLIEQIAEKNPQGTRIVKSHEVHDYSQVPLLLGNEVFLHPRTGYRTIARQNFESAFASCCRRTLDDFFQNFDEISAEFGKQKNGHSCRNPLQGF